MRAVFPHRRFWVAGAVAVPVIAVAYHLWAGDHAAPARATPEPTFTLEEMCRDSLADGWRVKHPPNLPGPYRRRLPGFLYYHPGPDGSSTVRFREQAGAVVWEERTRPGVDFLTLVLETSDGRHTEGLLVRGE